MKLDSLWRYPIKGLSAERLSFVELIKEQGFYFDRAYAITDGSFDFDERNPVPMLKSHFLMLAKYERLSLLKTRIDPYLHEVTVEDGQKVLIFRLRCRVDREAFADFLSKFLDVPFRGRAQVAFSPGHQFTDVSVHSTALMRSISLINLATVRDLGEHVGMSLDPRRFRANIYFDGGDAWSELDWVGRKLHCGDAVLNVVRRTRRCPATSVNLATGERDVNLPLAIKSYVGHFDCGIYVEVAVGGRIESGMDINIGV
ncbi:MOSC domain containing protein [Komagataeibacter xylinus E25]|nr:MOSC domain containing protein [Komagataeibacter xylinus E25]